MRLQHWKGRKFRPGAGALGIIAAGLFTSASALATPCTVAAVQGLHIPGVTISSASVLTALPANPPIPVPAYCQVVGTVETDDNQAGFQANLPLVWNHKFLFFGVGGLAGDKLPEAFGSANVTDQLTAPFKGYAVLITDTGHTAGETDGSWALNPDGTPAKEKLTDYFFRATHAVTVTGKQLVSAFYDADIQRAYFDGCSNGGRQAMMEASRFPDDYDGIIVGDPFMSLRSILGGVQFNKQQLSVPPSLKDAGTFIPFTKLPMIDAATTLACDGADGVVDGLIQNPGACHFDPNTLVKANCVSTDNTCLSQGEADTLKAYFTAARDDEGNVIYPGNAISNLAKGPVGFSDVGADGWSTGFLPASQINFNSAEPWGVATTFQPIAWQFVDNIIRFIVERDKGFNTLHFDGATLAPLSDTALNFFDKRTHAGDADDPEKFRRFIDKNKKLIIYHGFSDPALTAIRSIMFYEDLAGGVDGGIEETQENVRLFLVPGMHHCLGGPGPNVFDTLSALENWVEKGVAPDSIVALHFPGNAPTGAPGTQDRSMPLCKFPEEAHFKGGDVNNFLNWECRPEDRRLLDVGLNGREAGLGSRQARDDTDGHGDRDGDRDEGNDREHGGDH
jgi:feruloyl esterase